MPDKCKIKIAHFLSGSIEYLAGGDLVVLNLLKRLNGDRYDPWVICFNEARNPGEPLIISKAGLMGVKTFMINAGGLFDVGTVKRLKEFVVKNRIDILHCHGYKADVIGSLICKYGGMRKVTTLHGWWTGASLKLKLYNFLDIIAIRKFDKIVAVSRPIMDGLLKGGIPPDRLVYVENGVEVDRLDKSGAGKVRKELQLPEGTTILGMTGRLSKEKGHKYLFSAIQNMENVIIIVVGSGPLESRLKKLAENLNITKKVVFVGFKTNVNDYLAAMDIFLLPSLTEGLPLSLLEAMAAEKPIIASQVGGIPTVIEDRKTGLLVKPRDPVALKKAISTFIEDKDLAVRLALNARNLAVERFSLEKMAKTYESLYLDVTS